MAGALLQSGTATLIASDTFYAEDRSRFHLPLNFALLDSPWDALWLQAHIDAYLNAIPKDAWRDWVIGGHDKRRVASKVGQAQALRSRHDILVYERAWEGEELLVALNTAHQPRKLDWQGWGTRLLSTYLDGDGQAMESPVLLRADEGVIVKLQGGSIR